MATLRARSLLGARFGSALRIVMVSIAAMIASMSASADELDFEEPLADGVEFDEPWAVPV